ncbi:MAG: endonuclease III domain-containing protein [Endomicrobiales bacterium]
MSSLNIKHGPYEIYRKLYAFFGPQGWWPVTPRGSLDPSYRPLDYARAGEAERCEICAGAILTQNTAWANVEKAIANLNRAQALQADRIAGLPARKLERLIRPSGYFRQKTARLKGFAAHIRRHGSFSAFFSRPSGVVREELLSLSGIGPETADSMLLYAGGKRAFVVDAYTRRMGQRLGWFREEEYRLVRDFFCRRLPRSLKVYNEFHALIVALGKDYCRTRPRCGECPLKTDCSYDPG